MTPFSFFVHAFVVRSWMDLTPSPNHEPAFVRGCGGYGGARTKQRIHERTHESPHGPQTRNGPTAVTTIERKDPDENVV